MGEATLVAHTPKYRRLTDSDKVMALRYANDGLTQATIAQRLGCDQATISRWLAACQDTTAEATAFFRGQALRMAEKVVKEGRPSDHIKALQGVSVLTEERSSGLVIQIGGGSGDVKVAVFAPSNREVERRSSESLSITQGSDNASYVNQD